MINFYLIFDGHKHLVVDDFVVIDFRRRDVFSANERVYDVVVQTDEKSDQDAKHKAGAIRGRK